MRVKELLVSIIASDNLFDEEDEDSDNETGQMKADNSDNDIASGGKKNDKQGDDGEGLKETSSFMASTSRRSA